MPTAYWRLFKLSLIAVPSFPTPANSFRRLGILPECVWNQFVANWLR